LAGRRIGDRDDGLNPGLKAGRATDAPAQRREWRRELLYDREISIRLAQLCLYRCPFRLQVSAPGLSQQRAVENIANVLFPR
jgi:hypothetical protein